MEEKINDHGGWKDTLNMTQDYYYNEENKLEKEIQINEYKEGKTKIKETREYTPIKGSKQYPNPAIKKHTEERDFNGDGIMDYKRTTNFKYDGDHIIKDSKVEYKKGDKLIFMNK